MDETIENRLASDALKIQHWHPEKRLAALSFHQELQGYERLLRPIRSARGGVSETLSSKVR